MEQTLRDFRYAIRRIRANPGFVLVAVFSIALGVGANTSNFAVVSALLLPESPYKDPETLVELYPSKGETFSFGTLSYPEIEDIIEGSGGVFADVGAGTIAIVQENFSDRSESVLAAIVTGNYFGVVGGSVGMGRPLTAQDDLSPGGHPVAVLGHSFWQKRFAGGSEVLGKSLRLNGLAYTIIGIASQDTPAMIPGLQPDVWVPVMMINEVTNSRFDQLQARGYHVFFSKARLRPGTSMQQVQGALDKVVQQVHSEFPDTDDAWTVRAVSTTEVGYHPLLDRFIYPLAAMLLVIPAIVLLIACVNLASFLLARAADRRREIAIRLALGARRSTLIRQLLTETTLISLLGGALGLLTAYWSMRLMGRIELPGPVEMNFEMGLNASALVFTLFVSLAAGILFGLLPALQTTKADVAPALKDEAALTPLGRRFRIRDSLVVGQVALSSLLLICAGLFLRSLWEAQTADPGFARSPTAVVHLRLARSNYDADQARNFFRQVAEESQGLAGIEAVGMTSLLPLSGSNFFTTSIEIPGVEPPSGQTGHRIDFAVVDNGFFRAMGIPLERGEDFSARGQPDGERVIIISRAMSQRFWPATDPLGQFVLDRGGYRYRIIGVASDIHVRRLGESPRPYLYTPLAQNSRLEMLLVAKAQGNARQAAEKMAEIAVGLNPDAMVVETKTMEEHLGLMLVPFRAGGIVLGIFGALTVIMAVIGLYGIVKYSAAGRRREMGVRLSLGAPRSEVIKLVVGAGLKLVARGIVGGVMMAAALTWTLQSVLFGVKPFDLATYLGVAVVMLGLAAAASLAPAIGASKTDPALTLREDA